MVAGTLEPTEGGRRLQRRPQVVGRINYDVGYITQKNFCLPWRTVKGNIRLPLEFRKFSKVKEEMDARVKEAVDKVGLPEASRTPIRDSCPAACCSA